LNGIAFGGRRLLNLLLGRGGLLQGRIGRFCARLLLFLFAAEEDKNAGEQDNYK
jgi:hypothetical protein